MSRRTLIKWLHWGAFAMILYFLVVEPEENRGDPGGALSTHAGLGALLALVVAVWVGMYLRRGPAGRPGPKLPAWGRRLHVWVHRVLYLGLPMMVLSGALAGLLAPFAIRAFGTVPVFPGIGSKPALELAQELHGLLFNALLAVILVHALSNIWRQFRLRDNALRIMVPRRLHRFL